MSETYNANGTVPVATKGYTPVAISSSTNASPISVSTGMIVHGFNDGDTVEILGHKVNTAANGLWQITKTSTTDFTLNGSTGNGAGGATGYATDYSVNPLITIPDDGDAVAASSVNPAFEGIFNTVPFAYQHVGAYRLIGVYEGSHTVDPPDNGPVSTTTPTMATWTNCTSLTALLSFGTPAPVLKDTDFLEITMGFTFEIGGTVGTGAMGFALAQEIDGGSYSRLPKSIREVAQMTPITGTANLPLTMTWWGTGFSAATYGNLFNLGLQCYAASNSTTDFVIVGSYQIVCKHYRSNG